MICDLESLSAAASMILSWMIEASSIQIPSDARAALQ